MNRSQTILVGGNVKKELAILIVLAALVLVLVAPSLAVQPAEAAGVCPAPGTGLAGALNMAHDATMLETMADHTAPQGDAGMVRAVTNTACP